MRFLVRSHRKRRDVRAHRVLRKLEANVGAVGSPLLPVFEAKAEDVRDEVALADPAGPLAHSVEIVGVRSVAVAEVEGALKNEIEISKEVQNERSVGDGKQARGLSVGEVLVGGVERRREETSILPLEHVACAPAVPDPGRPSSSEHQHDLFVEMPLWKRLLSGSDLQRISIAGPPRAVEVDERATRSEPRPLFERQAMEVLDEVATINRHASGPLPRLVKGPFAVRDLRQNFSHDLSSDTQKKTVVCKSRYHSRPRPSSFARSYASAPMAMSMIPIPWSLYRV